MVAITEGDLEIVLPPGIVARRFDGAEHRLSHCMKAVDFVIELSDRVFFLEIKDPEQPGVPPQGKARFAVEMKTGRLDQSLVRKYRDTFLYEWACDKVHKPVYYVVLIALSTLDEAELSTRADCLKTLLPSQGPPLWTRRIVEGCVVLNEKAWKRHFPAWPLSRLSKRGARPRPTGRGVR